MMGGKTSPAFVSFSPMELAGFEAAMIGSLYIANHDLSFYFFPILSTSD